MVWPSDFPFVAAPSLYLFTGRHDGEFRHMVGAKPMNDHLSQLRAVNSELIGVQVRLALFHGLERVMKVRLRTYSVGGGTGNHGIDGGYNLKETAHRSIPLGLGRANI